MSKKKPRKRKDRRKRGPQQRQFPWHWLAFGAAAILLAAAGLFAWEPWSSDKPKATPQVTGRPRLSVDQLVVDEGYVKFNVPVRTTFRLSNVGDQPLEIFGKPQVQLVAGC